MMVIVSRIVHSLLRIVVIRYYNPSFRTIADVESRVISPRTITHPTKLVLASLEIALGTA